MPNVAWLARDLRFSVRQMRHSPLVSVVALLSLALGIGANVAIFSLVNALMLKALPVHDPDRLVEIFLQATDNRANTTSFTNPQWEYLRDHQDFFAGASAVGQTRFNLNTGGATSPAAGMFVDGRFFNTLGVPPLIGRVFTVEDDRRGGGADGPVAILSYGFWQRRFGGDPSIVGQALTLDGHTFTIIGVTPREFFGFTVGRAFDVALPLSNEAIVRGAESSLDRRSTWWMTMFARLAPGQTIDQAAARLRAIQPQFMQATMPPDWRQQDKDRYITDPFSVRPAGSGISALRSRYSQPLYVLLAIVGLVLTIACANMANLLLAQSVSRRKELAVRLSLGASRGQLVRQLLIESLMLSTI